MLFRIFAFVVVMALCLISAKADAFFGISQKINENWKFCLGDEYGARLPGYDDHLWRSLDLPHDWSIEATPDPKWPANAGYLPGGIAWYRKCLEIPEEKRGEKVFIYFEGVYNNSEVYVNGRLVGKRPNGYVSFLYDITPYVRYGEKNNLAVRVDHSMGADSRWYNGSGIYRDVYLIYSNPVHIDKWGVFCRTRTATSKKAVLDVDVAVRNETERDELLAICVGLFSEDGECVAQTTSPLKVQGNGATSQMISLTLQNPLLWSPGDPRLYTIRVSLFQGDKNIDGTSFRTGIRKISMDPDKGLFINGKSIKIKGVCIHHDAGALGSAVPRQVWVRRLETIKTLGCNAIRMSHNPHVPYLYDLCDEMGFLVIPDSFDEWEYPKRKWEEGFCTGKPGYQGSFWYFDEWSSRDIRDMVLRDRNHCSIFMWMIGNEIDYPNDPYTHPVLGGKDSIGMSQPGRLEKGVIFNKPSAERLGTIAERLVSEVKSVDPTRPVSAALAGISMSNKTGLPAALDAVGYNYTEGAYSQDHEKYPSRIIYGSENTHTLEAWKIARDNDYVFGQFIWVGVDYLGEAEVWPSRGLYRPFFQGLLDMAGFMKPRAYFRKALWTQFPLICIGTCQCRQQTSDYSIDEWPIWNYEKGDRIRIMCYTNCPQAKLLLNGRQVGNVKDYDDKTGVITWDLDYEPGTLEAVGLDDGKEKTRHTIKTAGKAACLEVVADRMKLGRDKDLAHVIVYIRDRGGNSVPLAENEISCSVTGPGKLLGLEAGSNTDMSNNTSTSRKAYRGRLLGYIQTSGEKGIVSVVFSSPGLTPATVNLVVE